jgi:hypothetical protein
MRAAFGAPISAISLVSCRVCPPAFTDSRSTRAMTNGLISSTAPMTRRVTMPAPLLV